jgi:hypothetical protein
MSKSTPLSASRVRLLALIIAVTIICVGVVVSTLVQRSSALTNSGSITTLGSPLTENFDTLASTGTNVAWADNVTIPGWYSSRTTYNSGTGSSNTGALYSFGVAGTNPVTDRALGSVGSGTTGTIYWGVRLTNNTGTTITSVDISYIAEQWRNGGFTPPATASLAQTVDFQYRVASPGTVTAINTPGTGWTDYDPLDFTSPIFGASAAAALDGNAAANRVSKSSTLTVSISNGQELWLRWVDINHPDNDHALAIDDFSVTAHGAGPTNPTGVGAASPSSVQQGNSSLLTVTVTRGANPTSTGLAVVGNLSTIGGSATQSFFDDGTHGDLTLGDNVFSFQSTVSLATSTGLKTLPTTISDAQVRSSNANISLTVTPASTSPTGVGSANPNSLQPGNSSLLTVNVTPGTNPGSTSLSVSGDLTSIGGSASQQFFDNGTNGDALAGDNIFSYQALVSNGTSPGAKSLPITVSDAQLRSTSTSVALTVLPPPPPTTIKISQVYGGGGNSGATYTNDFIEVFNQGPTTIDVSSWSVQYQSAAATGSWQVTNMCPAAQTCTVAPGHYYLVQESLGAGGTTPLPTADATGTIAMSGTQAKVALVNSTVALNTPVAGGCPTPGSIADLIGYGATNCSETSPTGTTTNTTAAVRRGNGCVDTDNNLSDFVIIGPIPRNSASPVNSCGGDPTKPSGLGLASPSTLDPASNTLLSVIVTPATAPPSTGISVSADLSSIGGPASQQFYDDGTNGDVAAGDNQFSYRATVGAAITTGAKSIVATITDAQSRTATAPITLTIQSPTCGVERWSVKVGTDADVNLVDLNNPVRAFIPDLGAFPAPADPPGPPDNARITPQETTVYVVNAKLTFYKKETDVDYHLVLQDDNGHTMIAEIPNPACVVSSTPPRVLLPSPLAAGIANARAKFDARFTATTFFQTANIPVQVKGVGFFDFIHGQTGVAPNGIELHPVIDISFTADTSTTLLSSANPSQFGQSVGITATVTNGGGPTPTGDVNFFDNGVLLGTRTLDVNGQATFNTNSLSVGSHPITAHYEGDSASATSTATALTQVVNKADQTINFGPLAGKTYGDSDFSVSATSSSGLPVSFSIFSGPATISGNLVHISGAGVVTVRASQAGDDNYNPAPDTDQSFTVAHATPTITWSTPGDIVYGTALSSTQLNATASVPGSFNYTPPAGTLLGAGTHQPLLASFTPTDSANYAATSKTVFINVAKATPSFGTLSSPFIVYGTPLTNLSGNLSFGSLTPTGGVDITVNSVTQNAPIQVGGNFTSSFATGALAAGSYGINYNYGGDSNFDPASGSGTLTVGYGISPQYDQTKVSKSGSTIPIKLIITDANGNNISSAGIVITAVNLVQTSTNVSGDPQDSGNSNPDNNFRFAGDSYIYNLKTTGLTAGVYKLYFTVGGNPTLYNVQFEIR